ncbi:Protein of unknown function (DUF1645 [Striga hermonthica]|uniref:Uncharacterized protein n=1 Tax=Striga hermonthica TaxID=68872 RepID=A0A9N7ND73_STRHE|nr:Protein of unknown function (DUF1645 [Striga hermonthica]
MQAGPLVPLSPSFNSYSNPRLAVIAARVAGEFDSGEFYEDFYSQRLENPAQDDQRGAGISEKRNPEADSADRDEDCDFAFVTRGSGSSSPIPADEVFQNGKIRPVYPVFNRDLLGRQGKFQCVNEIGGDVDRSSGSCRPRVRHPLRDLFIEERGTTILTVSSSSSSSEADDSPLPLPLPPSAEDGRREKSISAGGNSKRWRFNVKELVRRSQSERSKGSIVLLAHTNSAVKREDEKRAVAEAPSYRRGGDDKRRSYLPYRQDLVGFFGNVYGLRRNFKRS